MATRSGAKVVESIRSSQDYRRSVQRAIRAAKDAAERPQKKGMWVRPLAIGLVGGLVAFYGISALNTAIRYEYGKCQPTRQQAQRNAIPAPVAVAAPAAAKASPIIAKKDIPKPMPEQRKAMPAPMAAAAHASHAVAKKDTPNTRPELIRIINANAKCGEGLGKADYKISNMKEQLAKAMGTAKTEKPGQAAEKPGKPGHAAAVSSPPAAMAKHDTAKQDTSSIWESAFSSSQSVDSTAPMEVFKKAPAFVQKYLTYGIDSLNSSKIRIHLDKIIGGDERYLGIKLDSKVVGIGGSEKGGKSTCIIMLADKTFTIEMEKKGGMFARKYADIRIQEKGVSAPYTKNAWFTVDTKGEMGGDGSSLGDLSVMAISVIGAKQSASF